MRRNIGLPTLLLCVLTGAMHLADGRSSEDANVIGPPPTHRAKNADCCLNGGLCVLRSFCHCPKNYYGRHCEYFMRHRPCGTMKHDTWQRRGCNLCRCADGILACFSRLFAGCDDVATSTNSSAEPVMYNFRKTKEDRKNSIQLSSDASNSARHWSTWPSVIATLATCLVFVCR